MANKTNRHLCLLQEGVEILWRKKRDVFFFFFIVIIINNSSYSAFHLFKNE